MRHVRFYAILHIYRDVPHLLRAHLLRFEVSLESW